MRPGGRLSTSADVPARPSPYSAAMRTQKGDVMDHHHFDRLTTALGAETGRRRAVMGLLAGATVMLGRGTSSEAKKRKKKSKCQQGSPPVDRCPSPPDLCPQRNCCYCFDSEQVSTGKCRFIEGSDEDAVREACKAFCSPDPGYGVNYAVPGTAHFCDALSTCRIIACPVPL